MRLASVHTIMKRMMRRNVCSKKICPKSFTFLSRIKKVPANLHGICIEQ